MKRAYYFLVAMFFTVVLSNCQDDSDPTSDPQPQKAKIEEVATVPDVNER